MTTAEPLPSAGAVSDGELVHDSLAGDRAAFGSIVARHQSAVCAITYGAAGKLQLGQDLAQETFLEAWRSLATLRDPSQLRAWLCGIARNVSRNALRRMGELPPADAPESREHASTEAVPEDSAISSEERRLVWQALEKIPAGYREPLILFYWEDQSARRVGEALGLSEEAVKQRLSRGRKLLRAEVEARIAEGLMRLRPGRTFTAAVLAALPLGAREAAAAGTMAATAKTVGALGAAGAGGLAGALVGVGGAFVGVRASIVNTRSPRERRFMVQMAWLAVAFSAAAVALQAAVAIVFPALFRSVGWHVSVAAIETAALVWFIRRSNRRQREIQQEDGTATPPLPSSPRTRRFGVVFTVLCLAYVLAAFVAQEWLKRRFPEFAASAYGQVTFVALYGVGLLQLILWASRRQHAIHAAEGSLPASPPSPPQPAMSRRAVYESLGGGIFGSVCWMLPMCVIAGDLATALVVVVAALVAFRWGTSAALRDPQQYFRIASRVFAGVGAVTLVVVNLRWDVWMVAYRQSSLYQGSADLPLWAMNLLLAAVIAWTTIPLALRGRG